MAQSINRGGTRKVTANRSRRQPEHMSRATITYNGSAAERVRPVQTKSERKKKESAFQGGKMDLTLLFLIFLIVAAGLIVMLSASSPAGIRAGDPYYFFKKQIYAIIAGTAGMFVISRLNLDKWLKFIPVMFWVCVVLLGLVLIPGVGVEVNGSRRWLPTPIVQLQPSELMKPMMAMYIAYLVKIELIDLKKLGSNIFCVVIIGVVSLLMMAETHLSGTIVIAGIAVCVMMVAGTPIKPMLIGALIMGVVVWIYLQFDEVRMARVTSLFNPFANAQDEGYQISQSLYAIGSGRLFGLGLGRSIQKYSNLPEPYNDFIFSVMCEELGFVGTTIVVLLFVALLLKTVRIAMNAPDVWSTLTCVGIAAQLGIQTIFNMGVAVSILPNTGVSLPFFSYGGTSILTLLLEMGVLLNVSRKITKS